MTKSGSALHPHSIDHWVRYAATRFDRSATAHLDARLLIRQITGFTDAELILNGKKNLTHDQQAAFQGLVERRSQNEPMAYLLGSREFWGQTYAVTPDVLIPRPDSETLVRAVINRRRQPHTILDLGTGSGCLLGALLAEYPLAVGLGIDVSAGASAIARRNLAALDFARRALIVRADWMAAVHGSFDVIISNPPYIDPSECGAMQPDVALFEPACALFAHDRGRSAYRTILTSAADQLAAGGLMVIEIGDGHADFLCTLAAQLFATAITSVNHDLAGRPRALVIDYGA